MDILLAHSHKAFVASSSEEDIGLGGEAELVLLSGGSRNGKVTAILPGADYTETYPIGPGGYRHSYHWQGKKDLSSGMRIFQPGQKTAGDKTPSESPYIYACPSCSMRDAMEGALADCPVCHVVVLQMSLISSYIKGRDDMGAALSDRVTREHANLVETSEPTFLAETIKRWITEATPPTKAEIQAKVDPFLANS